MKTAATLLILFLLSLAAANPPGPQIPYFTRVRDVRITEADRQNYVVIDEELWTHSRPDLGDLRLYDGDTPVQYALSEQRAGLASDEIEAKILNLGSINGHTEFDLDTGGLPEYDRIRLRLDAHDFVAIASVSGGSVPGKSDHVDLTPSTLYDFTKEQLGSNSQLKVRASSFRNLHVRLTPGLRPDQIKGATIYDLHEQQASWTRVGTCAAPQQKLRTTVIACDVPPKVPLSRIAFQIAPSQLNFRRTVSVEDDKGSQIAAGEISRVRINLITTEELAVNVANNSGRVIVNIENGENPPLAITATDPLTLERRVYFDPDGKTNLRLYYGDAKLESPAYDYARVFHQEGSPRQAQLATGIPNPQYSGRPDDRPWSDRHTAILWMAMLLAVLVLAILAIRGLRSARTQ